MSCSSGVLMLLSGNYIRANYQSKNGLKLNRIDGPLSSVPYVLSADPGGTVVAAQNGTIDYMQNNLLNLLGLLGGSSADLPFYVKPTTGTIAVEGTYTDRITVKWDWYLCQGLGLFGACLLGADSGSATTVVDVTLKIELKKITVTTNSVSTWDSVNGTSFPKTLPNSKRKVSISVANPDIVATDKDPMVVVPIAGKQYLSLLGDGGNSPIGFDSGASGTALKLSYVDPGSTTDDVDFSIDGGQSWAYAPSGDAGSQRIVNAVRFKPKGSVAAGSNFTVSFPVTIE